MYDLITVGDVKLDTFIVIPDAHVMCTLKMPECQMCIDYGKKVPVDAIASQIAGSAPNVAVGLAKMKLSTAVKSVMGKDATHILAGHFLKQHEVDTGLLCIYSRGASSLAHGYRLNLSASSSVSRTARVLK